jgi:hypothetical protein
VRRVKLDKPVRQVKQLIPVPLDRLALEKQVPLEPAEQVEKPEQLESSEQVEKPD